MMLLRKITTKLSITLIDDDMDDRDYFLEALSEVIQFFEFQTFKTGEDAIDYFSKPNCILPDFLFLDINLPQTNGFEVLDTLRKDISRTSSLPIAMYSTSNLSKDIETSLANGANVYLTKPNNFNKLRDSLHRILMMKLNYGDSIQNFVM